VSDREFLVRHAKDLRYLAAASDEKEVRAGLIGIAEEFEQKVADEPVLLRQTAHLSCQ
jgi:hypothetical protein